MKKFRAWDNQNNRYFEPIYNATQGQLEELLINQNGRLSMWCMTGLCDESTFPNRFIIEWFTGLKDKNGVDIYEGDILDCQSIFIGRKHLVVWNEKTCSFCLEILEDLKSASNKSIKGTLRPIDFVKTIEIIGNIHENANLLT